MFKSSRKSFGSKSGSFTKEKSKRHYRGIMPDKYGFQDENYEVNDESKRFKRPILAGVTTGEVCTFYAKVKTYLAQVSAAQLSSSKSREAKNLIYCATPVVLRYLVDYGFKNQKITGDGGVAITSIDAVTSDLFYAWVEKKASTSSGPDVENRKKAFIEELLTSGKHRFKYVPGDGTMREQLLFHDSKLAVHYDEQGMGKVMTDRDKIALHIRLFTPWALSRCSILALTAPGHVFLNSIDETRKLIESDYSVFKKEIFEVIVHEIAAGIQWNPDMLNSLCKNDLTTAEELQVGSLFKESLKAKEVKKNEYRLQALEKRVLGDRYPSNSNGSMSNNKRTKIKKVVSHDSEEEAVTSDEDVGKDAMSMDESSGDEDGSSSSSSTSEEGLDDDSYNLIKMRFLRENERRGNACTNCGKLGCFSAKCNEKCKFCLKSGCNSWTCSKRPKGYGKNDAFVNKKGFKKVHIRKLNVYRVNQVSATICNYYEVNGVLLDSGADKCCITQKLLNSIESRTGNRITTKKLSNPIFAEFANGDTVKCSYIATIPIVELRQKNGGIVPLANLKCLVIPGDLEELIIGQDILVGVWGIDIVEAFNKLNTSDM
jgi:hypothetical protein